MTETPTRREWMRWMDYLMVIWGWLWVFIASVLLLGKLLFGALP